MKLERRNIVVTGGTSGIGLELVRRLYEANRLFVIASNPQRLRRLEAGFPGVKTFRADLAHSANVEAAALAAGSHFGRLDVLINNAAIQNTPTFVDEQFDPASIGREIAVNFTALCVLTALLLPSLIHDRRAAIVNLNSGLGLVPKKNSAVYCATKAAVDVFSQSLRYQLEGTDVRVLQAFMPLVDTGMTTGRGENKLSPAEAAESLLDGVEREIEDHDIGRVRLLRLLMRFAPRVAQRIMKSA